MLTILLHSSKTMQLPEKAPEDQPTVPRLLEKTEKLAGYIQSLSIADLEKCMKLSKPLAEKTHQLWQNWTVDMDKSRPAIDCFLGDIYSGLQVRSFTPEDRIYAHRHLLILSGLYGGLRALDGIQPYRLEMGYRLIDELYRNLYNFWDGDIAALVPEGDVVINLSAVEYTRAVLPYLVEKQIYTPKFLTINPKTNKPTFVAVHAKIARGAFANWLIRQRVEQPEQLSEFKELGYAHNVGLSQPNEPVFICQNFGGLGLSIRKV